MPVGIAEGRLKIAHLVRTAAGALLLLLLAGGLLIGWQINAVRMGGVRAASSGENSTSSQ